jgi:hypothetical protein
MILYFTYGQYHSRVQLMASGKEPKTPPKVMAD